MQQAQVNIIVRLASISAMLFLTAISDLWASDDAAARLPAHHRYLVPQEILSPQDERLFRRGLQIFRHDWAPSGTGFSELEGLGPLFNRFSCIACHPGGGRGKPPTGIGQSLLSSILFLKDPNGIYDAIAGRPVPEELGGQFHPRAIRPVVAEGNLQVEYEEIAGRYPDGHAYSLRRPIVTLKTPEPVSPDLFTGLRVGQSLFGLGLVDGISRSEILKNSDPEDRDGDGISGRPNWVGEGPNKRLGKFGWKASRADLLSQNTVALHQDIGITSPTFPVETCIGTHNMCESDKTDISSGDLLALTFFTQKLAASKTKVSNADGGDGLFRNLGCSACHKPTLMGGDGELVVLYSDLLLHDMGNGLSDGVTSYDAKAAEWRTPPLWGLSRQLDLNGHSLLLHDGRARNLEEAILWHGGEAEASKNAFKALPKAQRQMLIGFLKQL